MKTFFCLFVMSIVNCSVPAQNHYSKDNLKGPVPQSLIGNFGYGKSLDLRSPWDPVSKTRSLLVATKEERNNSAIQASNALSPDQNASTPGPASMRWVTNTTYTFSTDESSFVSKATFELGAKFGFSDISAGYRRVRENRRSKTFLLITVTGEGSNFNQGRDLTIDERALPALAHLDSLDDMALVFDRFVNEFGTHYVSAIQYGYRVSALITINSADQNVSSKIQSSISSAFANGSFTQSSKETFAKYGVSSEGSFIGGLQQNLVINDLSTLASLIKGINDGTIPLVPAPVYYEAQTLRTKIPSNFKKLISILSSQPAERAVSHYGVPSGTVIAWLPRNLSELQKTEVNVRELVPNGWTLCDGQNGTPNLNEHFLAGTDQISVLSSVGGSNEHSHTGEVQAPKGTSHKFEDGGHLKTMGIYHKHAYVTDTVAHVPPHVKVLFIMKD